MATEMAMLHDVARCSACRACMLGCPEHAISQKDSGAVVIDENKCVGCDYCRTNCPFNVPRLAPERNKSTKCDLCFDRIEHGMIPSCAKTCTAEAIHFGTKAAMTKLAEERLKEVRMNHPNAQLYGVPANPKTPESIDPRRDYIRPLGKIAVGGTAAGLAGLMILNKLIGKKGA